SSITMTSCGKCTCCATLRSAALIQRPALWHGMITENRIGPSLFPGKRLDRLKCRFHCAPSTKSFGVLQGFNQLSDMQAQGRGKSEGLPWRKGRGKLGRTGEKITRFVAPDERAGGPPRERIFSLPPPRVARPGNGREP